jgi:hypothetical protein
LSLDFYSQHIINTALRAFKERLMKTVLVRCQDLPIWFLHCFMRLPPHATAVVVGATAVRSTPLHHSNHRLQPHRTAVCWRGPCPLPLTDRLTDLCSPRTLMPLHEVAEGGRVLYMVGVAPIGLHRHKGPHHRAVRGRTRKEKKMTTSATSWWSPVP